MLDTSLNENEKDVIYKNITQEINELNHQKSAIEKQYKKDKNKLK